MPTLIVHRDRAFADKLRRYRLVLDGVEVGQLREGSQLEVPLARGAHVLEARIDWCGSRPLHFDCDGADVRVHVSSTLRGWRLLFALRTVLRQPRDYLQLRLVEPDR